MLVQAHTCSEFCCCKTDVRCSPPSPSRFPPRSRCTWCSSACSRFLCRAGRSPARSASERGMENLELLLHGFTIAITLPHLALMLIGVFLGILVGVLPGLGAPNGVSLLLPLTFGMAPVSAIILLSSMYWGALFGGSVTLHSVQYSGRALVGGYDFRRLPDGARWPAHDRAGYRLRLGRIRGA